MPRMVRTILSMSAWFDSGPTTVLDVSHRMNARVH
jgi:hypothetical protein